MKTRIIKIGNSQGARIPKPLLEQASLGVEVEVELEVRDSRIVIRSAERPRQGWDGAFARMAEHSDDDMLDDDAPGRTRWDQEEWEW